MTLEHILKVHFAAEDVRNALFILALGCVAVWALVCVYEQTGAKSLSAKVGFVFAVPWVSTMFIYPAIYFYYHFFGG